MRSKLVLFMNRYKITKEFSDGRKKEKYAFAYNMMFAIANDVLPCSDFPALTKITIEKLEEATDHEL